MRTTIDLPEDIHRVVAAIARDNNTTFNATVGQLLRRVLTPAASSGISISPQTGFPTVRLGRTVTSEDVRSLDDDE